MADARDAPDRPPLDRRRLQRAKALADLAWRDLPTEHRVLLTNIGAEQRSVVDRPLGTYVDELLISSGNPRLPTRSRAELEHALGAWIDRLRLVVIDAGHPALVGLDDPSYETMIVRTFWHEWGHALSLARATAADVAIGTHLIDLAPAGVGDSIRSRGYRQRQYTHEVIAEIYALLMVAAGAARPGSRRGLTTRSMSS